MEGRKEVSEIYVQTQLDKKSRSSCVRGRAFLGCRIDSEGDGCV